MITKWWKRACEHCMHDIFYVTQDFDGIIPELRNTKGNIIPYTQPLYFGNVSAFIIPGDSTSLNVNNTYAGAVLGTGNNEPTTSDYWMQSELDITDVSVSNKKIEILTVENNHHAQKISFNITNGKNTSITLREIGYWRALGALGNAALGNWKNDTMILVDRSLITPEITLQPNETAFIEYTITITGASGMS